MTYLYILLLKNNRLYKGLTDDLRRRFAEHKRGKVKSTKNLRPIKLIYYEAYLNKKYVTRREKFLKTTKGRRLLRQQLKEVLKEYKIEI